MKKAQTFILLLSLFVSGVPALATNYEVNIRSEDFDPEIFSVEVGDMVKWTNNDTAQHRVASDPHPAHNGLHGLDSGTLNPGQTYSYIFSSPGEFGYHDHTNLEAGGIITVNASTASPTPAPSPTPPPNPHPAPVPTPTPSIPGNSNAGSNGNAGGNSGGGGSSGNNSGVGQHNVNIPANAEAVINQDSATGQTDVGKSSSTPPTRAVRTNSGGTTNISDGNLVLDKGVIYVVEYGKKRPFSSMNVFTGMGYKLSNVIQADASSIPDGQGLFEKTVRHVRGTVVVDKGTVYFLGAEIRYAFPSAEIFFSWGLKFSDVIPANAADMQMPNGPFVEMKNN